MTFKDFVLKDKKESIYEFYKKVVENPKEITKITKLKIYEEIIKAYIDNPEIILNMLTTEQLELLKKILQEEGIKNKDYGYLTFMVLKDLRLNHLIFASKDKFYIPDDLINPVKMAINIYNKEEHLNIDIINNVVIGLIRIYNVVPIDQFIEQLKDYQINYNKKDFKEYCLKNPKVAIKKYQNIEYVISSEIPAYKDILYAIRNNIEPYKYSLEEVISIGKYWLNLFNQEQINFLSFVEVHLPSIYIEQVIKDIILYSGFGIENDQILKDISGNLKPLYEAFKELYPFLPCWIYKGWPLKIIKKDVK